MVFPLAIWLSRISQAVGCKERAGFRLPQAGGSRKPLEMTAIFIKKAG
jgi:hypothetical protein